VTPRQNFGETFCLYRHLWSYTASNFTKHLNSLPRPRSTETLVAILNSITGHYDLFNIFVIWKSFIFSMALPVHSGSMPLTQFCKHFSDGRTLRMSDQANARPLPEHRTHKHRISAYRHQKYMPWVGLEHTIPASKRAKTVHALESVATVTGHVVICGIYVHFVVQPVLLLTVCGMWHYHYNALALQILNFSCIEYLCFVRFVFALEVMC
jgi:hypothetical protein